MDYSFIDKNENNSVPLPLKNAGLYTGDVSFSKKPWGNDYTKDKVNPDAVSYAAEFYAKHHIPGGNRPGNNNLENDFYQYYDNTSYNFQCYKPYNM